MKLKKLLILAFLILTFLPIVIVSFLLYQSGMRLSQESYTRNLTESITVQVDYIEQTIENNMVADYRFANRVFREDAFREDRTEIFTALEAYLETAEDKIAVCILLDSNGEAIYTIGEKSLLEIVESQLERAKPQDRQEVREFGLNEGKYSLGIVTPVWAANGAYLGSMISIYNETYLFKIISSYYEIADTSTYICRDNGSVIASRGLSDQQQRADVAQGLNALELSEEGAINIQAGAVPVTGYYKNIYNSPWYLVGFVANGQIYAFANQFIWVYLLVIAAVFLTDVLLAVYVSNRVVGPINSLIAVMDGYPDSLRASSARDGNKNGYYETRYLWAKFLGLMKTVTLVQHNFEGVYQLYQSSAMDDTNIDIDVKEQTVHSNKETFESLMSGLVVPLGACVVERFTRCFCDQDQRMMMELFEGMRDKHLAEMRETEIFTPHLGGKWFHALVVPMYEDASLSRLYVQLRDISGFKKQEQESREQAKHEPLTGLYNRSGFADRVEQEIRKSGAEERHALLFLDMNDFKLVNDNCGHSAGDELLRRVAEALRTAVNPDAIVSRFGGDEFAVFLPDTEEAAANVLKEALRKKLVYPYEVNGTPFVITASVGVSLWSGADTDTLDELLKRADDEMYRNKRELKQKKGKEIES